MSIETSDYFWGIARRETLSHEGGFVNHPNDPGGATNHGVSLRFLRAQGIDLGDIDGDGDIDVDDIRAITPDQAAALFKLRLWYPCRCDDISDVSGAVAVKVFDIAVNTGPKQAIKILQSAINWEGAALAIDGAIGPRTLEALSNLSPKTLLAHICQEQAGFYDDLAHRKPDLKVFLKGWLKRAAWTPTVWED